MSRRYRSLVNKYVIGLKSLISGARMPVIASQPSTYCVLARAKEGKNSPQDIDAVFSSFV